MLPLLILVAVFVPTIKVAADRQVPTWCMQIRQHVTVLSVEQTVSQQCRCISLCSLACIRYVAVLNFSQCVAKTSV